MYDDIATRLKNKIKSNQIKFEDHGHHFGNSNR